MKKLFFLFLALVAIATGASAATDYGFKLLNVSINSDNYQSQSAGQAWSYDPSANVLHLTEGTISTTIPSATIIQIDGDVNPTLTIQVDGNCRITGTFLIGIDFSGSGNHTLCGDGTLSMNTSLINSKGIKSSLTDKVCLTIKDVTININAWGESPVGFSNCGFSKIILDNCEMNIRTSCYAWAAFGGNGVSPVLNKCYLSNGNFTTSGSAMSSGEYLKEVYIKRTRTISVIDITVVEPVAGNEIPTDCTPNSTDYYVTSVEWHHSSDGDYFSKVTNGSLFNIGEYYRVYVMLYPTEGNRFANEKEDITAYVNGEKAEIDNMSSRFVTIKYTFPQLVGTKYNLWVGGEQMTDVNKDDVLGNGKVMYVPATKTLSLKSGASIHGQGRANDAATGYGAGIYSEIDGLTIDVEKGGVEVIGADDCHGIYLRGNTTIKGEGTLSGKGYIGVFMGSNSADLTVDGNVMLVAEGTKTYGLSGYVRGFAGNIYYYTTLTIKGTSRVFANGVSKSIGDWNDLVLEDNHAITSPTGAVWNADKHAVCDASGNPIAGEWVLITTKTANPADVNKDGTVDSADIVAVIKEMPDGDKKADVNGDTVIDSADIVAVIKAMK